MVRYSFSGNSGKLFEYSAHLVATALNLIPRIGQFVDTVGSITGFRRWAKAQGRVKIHRTRESLWAREVLPRLPSSTDLGVVEFGVAFGDSTRWWCSHVDNSNAKFFCFDRFEGLPQPWRNMPKGAFNAGGSTPDISDERIKWIVGDVESTLLDFDWAGVCGPKVVLFDLDLYGATKICFESVLPHLSSGDLVYFDEAFDADERTLINDRVIPGGRFDLLAISPLGALYIFC